MLLNREKLAELLGCSLRTVDEHRRNGMPGEAPDRPGGQWRFESSQIIEWLRVKERQNALGEIANIDETEAKRRKIAAEAAIAEHELARLEGAAVSVADWTTATSKVIGASRAKLLSVGSAVGPEVAISDDPAECAALIQGAIDEALLELSISEIQIEPEGASEPEPGDTERAALVGAASGSDGKRVGRRGTKT